jgi:molybdate transport system substrate-binding protein
MQYTKLPLRNWKALLTQNTVSKIAIGNPAVAPYGKAAQQALNKLGMYDKLKPKLVFGESIAQVNTYIITGVVTLGFTTQALVADAGQPVKFYWQLVNPTLYQPIEQGMVQLKRSANNPDALKFYNYLLSPFAKAIFKKYGYRVK